MMVSALVNFLLGFFTVFSVAGIVWFSYQLGVRALDKQNARALVLEGIRNNVIERQKAVADWEQVKIDKEVVLVVPKTPAPSMNFNEYTPEPHGWMDTDDKEVEDIMLMSYDA